MCLFPVSVSHRALSTRCEPGPCLLDSPMLSTKQYQAWEVLGKHLRLRSDPNTSRQHYQTHLEPGHHGQHRGPALARRLLLGLLFWVSRKQHLEQGVLGLLQEPGQLRGHRVLLGEDENSG